MKLDRKQDLDVPYQFCVFRADQITRWSPRPLIGGEIFDFSSERNSTNLTGSKIATSSAKIMFLGSIGTKDVCSGLSLADPFSTSPLKPLNGIQRNLRGNKISTCPSNFMCFRADRKNKMAALASDWLRHFRFPPLKPLNRIQRNLTGSKILMSSTKFVFFWPIGKTRWPPWPLIGWYIFDFSPATAERNSMKLDR